jgi:hypothetical protein
MSEKSVTSFSLFAQSHHSSVLDRISQARDLYACLLSLRLGFGLVEAPSAPFFACATTETSGPSFHVAVM